jgi:microcystin-dependent protein
MAILNNPEDFVSGENITAAKLNNLVDGATFLGGAGQATDDSTLEVNDGVGGDGSLRVKDLGITTAKLADASVTEAKLANGAVTADKIAASAQSVLMPTGSVMAFAGSVAPNGYFVCNGQSVNTYTYRDLHAVISDTYGGTAYNAGVTDDPSATTTFNVPDLRGYVIAGKGNLLSSSDSLGDIGGSKSVTLTSAQSGMPAHSISVSVPAGAAYDGGNPFRLTQSPTNSGSLLVTGSVAGVDATSSHTNVQPTMILYYIIKY